MADQHMATLDGSLANIVDSETLKWVFVGGKGGVGKTTVSCSLALTLAIKRKAHCKSVLLISTDPAHNLSDAFSQKFSKDPSKVRGVDNLFAMEVEPPSRIDASSGASLPSNLQEAFGESQTAISAVNELIEMIPGIDEAMSFGVLMQNVQRMDHDIIIFDTAPTGHTMRLLGFPNLLEKALEKIQELHQRFGGMLAPFSSAMGMTDSNGVDMFTGIGNKLTELRDVTKRVIDQFQNETKTTFICVCIPEFLSVYETERLVQELNKFQIDTHNIVINQVLDIPLEDSDQQAAKLYAARVAIQQKYVEQIEELYLEDFHITRVPILHSEVRGLPSIEQFADRILGNNPTNFGNISESEYEPSVKNLIDQIGLKWIYVGGKGGVGKTTTSCALAVALARERKNEDKKILIISTDPAHNLSDAFSQSISSGGVPTKIEPYTNLYGMEIEPASSAESIAQGILPEDLLPPGLLQELGGSIPGIDEAVSFAQIIKLVKTMDFETIIFDTAPTGHTLRLLNFPSLLATGLEKITEMKGRFGPMMSGLAPDDPTSEFSLENASAKLEELKNIIEEVGEQLRDADQTTFVCVAIAEYLSVYETERLVQELATLGIDVHNIVVNQLLVPNSNDPVNLLRARAAMQKKYMDQVKELYPPDVFHITKGFLLPEEVRGVASLEGFANRFLYPWT